MKVVFYTDLVLLLASCGGGKYSSLNVSSLGVSSSSGISSSRSSSSNSSVTSAAPQTAINNSQPGDLIQFAAGTYTNSDFQINADPISTCEDEGIDFTDAERSPIPELGLWKAP